MLIYARIFFLNQTYQRTKTDSMNTDIIKQWLSFLQYEKQYSEHTIRAYKTDIEGFLEYLSSAERDLLQVDRYDIRSYLAFSKKTAPSASTLNRKISTLQHLFRWMQKKEIIERNPVANITRPRIHEHLPKVLEIDEACNVVENPAQKGIFALRNQAILELLYGAGLRVSEAATLNMENIDFEQSLVRVLGKGKKTRIVPFGPPAKEALEEYLKQRHTLTPKKDEKSLFLNKIGTRISTRSMWTICRDAGRENNISQLHPHAMRHSCATHLLSSGADLRSIQEQLGHSSLRSTQRYTKVDISQLMDIYRKTHPSEKKSRNDTDEY